MREPIQAPDGTQYSWNDEKKNYFDEKENELPKEGFDHEGVKYTYDIENLRWLADGKPLGMGKPKFIWEGLIFGCLVKSGNP